MPTVSEISMAGVRDTKCLRPVTTTGSKHYRTAYAAGRAAALCQSAFAFILVLPAHLWMFAKSVPWKAATQLPGDGCCCPGLFKRRMQRQPRRWCSRPGGQLPPACSSACSCSAEMGLRSQSRLSCSCSSSHCKSPSCRSVGLLLLLLLLMLLLLLLVCGRSSERMADREGSASRAADTAA